MTDTPCGETWSSALSSQAAGVKSPDFPPRSSHLNHAGVTGTIVSPEPSWRGAQGGFQHCLLPGRGTGGPACGGGSGTGKQSRRGSRAARGRRGDRRDAGLREAPAARTHTRLAPNRGRRSKRPGPTSAPDAHPHQRPGGRAAPGQHLGPRARAPAAPGEQRTCWPPARAPAPPGVRGRARRPAPPPPGPSRGSHLGDPTGSPDGPGWAAAQTQSPHGPGARPSAARAPGRPFPGAKSS